LRRQAPPANATTGGRRAAAMLACLGTLAVAAAVAATAPAGAGAATSRVAVIVMENKEAGDVLSDPSSRYVNALARRYGQATRSYAIRHPSLPNYLALTSGSTHGITSDCTDCHVDAPNIADQLERAHRSWKGYMEGLPAPCSTVAGQGRYAKKHDPFLYYDNVLRQPQRCRKVVGFDQLRADLRRAALPDFSFITPDQCHDTHDCSIGTGDRFLAGLVPQILRRLGPHGFLVLTWDEGTSSDGCCTDAHGGRVVTIVAGPDVRRGARMSRPVDHYGVLRTIESALGLGWLGEAAQARHGGLDGLFARPPHVR
jgi:hypothetical protein